MLAGKEVQIETDVVDSDIPLLLSLSTMKNANIKLDLENDEAEILGSRVALNYTPSGHYCVPIDKGCEKKIEEVCKVELSEMNDKDRVKTIEKLHRRFVHPAKHRLVGLLKDAGIWESEYEADVDQVYKDVIPANFMPKPHLDQ